MLMLKSSFKVLKPLKNWKSTWIFLIVSMLHLQCEFGLQILLERKREDKKYKTRVWNSATKLNVHFYIYIVIFVNLWSHIKNILIYSLLKEKRERNEWCARLVTFQESSLSEICFWCHVADCFGCCVCKCLFS